jgi:hypothetical protein
MIKTRSFKVDADDCDVSSAQVYIEAELSNTLSALEKEGVKDRDVISINILPAVQHYSIPDPDRFDRDFHYTDRGFIGIISYRGK